MMNGFILVALGGAIGASLRYSAGLAVGNGAQATLVVNVLGSLLLGALSAWVFNRSPATESTIWLLFGVGVLGAFTTYSAFSRETVLMFLEGAHARALMYAAANMVGALAAFAIGLFMLRRLLS